MTIQKELLWNSIMRLKENISLKQEVEDLKDELEKKNIRLKNNHWTKPSHKSIFSKINKALTSISMFPLPEKPAPEKKLLRRPSIIIHQERTKPLSLSIWLRFLKNFVESEFWSRKRSFYRCNRKSQRKI